MLNWHYHMKCSKHTKDVLHIIIRVLVEGETEAYKGSISAHIYTIAMK